MKTQAIAQRWIDFFAARGHEVVPSASLVSQDPSVLFTIAGMVPFVPYFTGRETAPWTRAVSVQKCLRTADIDEVGKTVRHGTFFQMCGNFSFGEYFKELAIRMAWELLTSSYEHGGFGLDPQRLWVTFYEDGEDRDEEARSIWRDVVGVPEERLQGTGKIDNFWHTGQPGPGGPCSEIYYDRGPEHGAEGGPLVDDNRYVEVWNLVFMQYRLSAVRSKVDFDIAGELPRKNIDTGLGLERLAMILQGVDNVYETDQLRPILDRAAALVEVNYSSIEDASDPRHTVDVRLRIVADHVRSALMLIADGVTPANEGRGYVLRRLIRRAVRSMRLLGAEHPVFPDLLPVARDTMQGLYPEIAQHFSRISRVAYAEEKAFLRTVTAGSERLDEAVSEARKLGEPLSGATAFSLHDTYGFPIDLTLEIAAEAGVPVDETTFRALMSEQRGRAREDARRKKTGHIDTQVFDELLAQGETTFIGYDELVGESSVRGVLKGGERHGVARAGEEIEIILDITPFYAEAGGQAADTGIITGDGVVVDILDVQQPVRGLSVHKARVREGELVEGAKVRTAVDAERRHGAEQAHTATHIVHAALRQILGSEATQRGSYNKAGYMRFDFAWGEGLSRATRSEIEAVANLAIQDDFRVKTSVMSLERARSLGALALFGERYGDQVRVVEIDGGWSRELCGGTHVPSTARVGSLALFGEQSVGAGQRRVEAFVGWEAFRNFSAEHLVLQELSDVLKVPTERLKGRAEELLSRLRAAEQTLARLKEERRLASSRRLVEQARSLGGTLLLASDQGPVEGAEELRALALDIRSRCEAQKTPYVIALLGQSAGRPHVFVVCGGGVQTAGVTARGLVKIATSMLGGGGGGKDDIAQGGGQDAAQIPGALDAIEREVMRHVAP